MMDQPRTVLNGIVGQTVSVDDGLPISADFVQKVSLPLEAFGFTLLIVELFYPSFIGYLEHWIDRLQSAAHRTIVSLKKWGILGVLFVRFRKPDPDLIGNSPKIHLIVFIYSIGLSILVMITVFVLLLVEFGVLVALLTAGAMVVFYKYWRGPVDLFGQLCFLSSLIPLYVVTTAVGQTFRFLNYIGRGKAFGALGIILSTVGFLGECYQVYGIEKREADDTAYLSFLVIHGIVLSLLIFWAQRIARRSPE